MTVMLRPVTADDADALAAMHHASWRETYAGLVPDRFWETFTVEAMRARWARLVQARPDAAVLAESEGGVVGFGLASGAVPVEGHAPVRDRQLWALYVLAAHHGTGLGQALLDAVLPPDAPAELWVADGNGRATRFYERNRFVRDGTVAVEPRSGMVQIRMVR